MSGAWPRIVLGCMFVLGPGCFVEVTNAMTAAKRPNILLLVSDQHALGYMGAYGNDFVKTPHLDSLAATGVRFSLSYCTSPLCAPARASLHTGRMPHTTGVNSNKQLKKMNWKLPNMGDALREAGYDTAWVGKLHLSGKKPGGVPAEAGPDGGWWSWGYYPMFENGIPGFENLNRSHAMKAYAKREKTSESYNVGLDVDPPVVATAIAYLKQPRKNPFFLVVSIMNPHDICFWEQIVDKYDWPRPPEDLDLLPPLPPNHAVQKDEAGWIKARRDSKKGAKYRSQWEAREWRSYLYAYIKYVEDADRSVGKILTALRESGLEDDTVVIYTSDHGEGVGAHHWRNKVGPYDEVTKVPFIVSWKGVTPAGKLDDRHLVSGVDVFPTVCDYAGAPVPEGLDGVSVREVIEDSSKPGRDFLVVESPGWAKGRKQDVRIFRTHRYKYMRTDAGEETLFDMKKDPYEVSDLAGKRKYQGVLQDHRNLLAEWVEQSRDHFSMMVLGPKAE